MKFNRSARKSPSIDSFFFNNELLSLKSIKGHFLGCNSPDSLAIFEKKPGRTFHWKEFFASGKTEFLIKNKINLREKMEEVTLV